MSENIREKYKGIYCIEFSGEDCGACRSLLPVLHALLDGRKDIKLAHVEVNPANKEAVEAFAVDYLPTVLLCDDGEIFARCHGFQPEEILELWIDGKLEEHLKKKEK